jgi:hypothetical protein
MKGLKARLTGGAVWGVASAIGIAMSWTQALGQSTPDCPVFGCAVAVPEPGMVGPFVAAAVGALLYKRLKK